MVVPDPRNSPPVWVLVLHWKGFDHTANCLKSARALLYANCQILVVDNGSDGDDGVELKQRFPDIDVLRLDDNCGFAGGCNAGMRYAMERGAEWIWLLNNDTTFAPDTLDQLMAAIHTAPQAAAISPVIVAHDQPSHLSGTGIIDFRRAKTLLKRPAACPHLECDWLSGCALLLRAKALKQVGLFDEDYFLYFEDTDLCQRLRLAGWQCLLVTAPRVTHVNGASTAGKLEYWRAYYYSRNRFLFFGKYAQGWRRILSLLSITAHLSRHLVVLPLRGSEGRRKLRAEMLGLRDYIQKKFGKATCLSWCD